VQEYKIQETMGLAIPVNGFGVENEIISLPRIYLAPLDMGCVVTQHFLQHY
jgi:hypothetical protein